MNQLDEEYADITSSMVTKQRLAQSSAAMRSDAQTVAQLCELFSEIDFNGDGTVEWDEFTSFLIESAKVQHFSLERIKPYSYVPMGMFIPQAVTNGTASAGIPAKQVHVVGGARQHRWVLGSALIEEPFRRIFSFPTLDYVICCGKNRRAKVLDAFSLDFVHYIEHGGAVLYAQHLPEHNLIATSSADLTVKFWDETTFELKRQLPPVDESQTSLFWHGSSDTLFSGSRKGVLAAWDPALSTVSVSSDGHGDDDASSFTDPWSDESFQVISTLWSLRSTKSRPSRRPVQRRTSNTSLLQSDMLIHKRVGQPNPRLYKPPSHHASDVSVSMSGENDTYASENVHLDTNGVGYMRFKQTFKTRTTFSDHKDAVMDLCYIARDELLASASLDARVLLWDLQRACAVDELVGHSKGVYAMAFSSEYYFLVSVGFEHDAFVWIPNTHSPPFRLRDPRRPHAASLVGVSCPANSPQIITADAAGMVKVWDIRNFQCVQTLSTETGVATAEADATGSKSSGASSSSSSSASFHPKKSKGSGGGDALDGGDGGGDGNGPAIPDLLSAATFFEERKVVVNGTRYSPIPESESEAALFARRKRQRIEKIPPRIIGAGKRMHVWEYEPDANPMLADDRVIVAALYNSNSFTFLTASGRDIRVWDARSGLLQQMFNDITQSEITAMCFDDRKRKFFVGTHTGECKCFNVANGAFVKDYTEGHSGSEISALAYCDRRKHLISTSWDGAVRVLDDVDPNDGIVLRTLGRRLALQGKSTPSKQGSRMGDPRDDDDDGPLDAGCSIDPEEILSTSVGGIDDSAVYGSFASQESEPVKSPTDVRLFGRKNDHPMSSSSGAPVLSVRPPSRSGSGPEGMATPQLGKKLSGRGLKDSLALSRSPALPKSTDSEPASTESTQRDINPFGHVGDVKCCAFSCFTSMILTGGQDKNVCVWEFDEKKPRLETKLLGHSGEISAVCWLGKFPAFVVADSNAMLYLYTCRPYPYAYRCLLQWSNHSVGGGASRQGKRPSAVDVKALAAGEAPPSVESSITGLAFDIGAYTVKTESRNGSRSQGRSAPRLASVVSNLLGGTKSGSFSSAAATTSTSTNDSALLWVSDERGWVRCWSLASVFDALQLDVTSWPRPPNAPPAYLHITSEPSVSSNLAQQIASFRAHREAIRCLEVLPEQACVLSCSYDNKARLWSYDGTSMGGLHQAPLDEAQKMEDPYLFVVDEEKKQNAELVRVGEVMKKIATKRRILQALSKEGQLASPSLLVDSDEEGGDELSFWDKLSQTRRRTSPSKASVMDGDTVFLTQGMSPIKKDVEEM